MTAVRLSFSEIEAFAVRQARVFAVELACKRIDAAEALAEAVETARLSGEISVDRVTAALEPIDAELLRESFPDLIRELVRRVESEDYVSVRDLVDGARAALKFFAQTEPVEMTIDQIVALELASAGKLDRMRDLGPRLARIERAKRGGVLALLRVFATEKARAVRRRLRL